VRDLVLSEEKRSYKEEIMKMGEKIKIKVGVFIER
jgi:hypothetical protein